MEQQHSLWRHLTLLLQSRSWESVEYILQVLWRTRRTGLDDTDRKIIREMLDLSSDSDLDPLLLCLRILIRKCVYECICKDEIHKLFPKEVLPELQRCLTLLFQKFQQEWKEDVSKVSLPRLKAMTWNMESQNADSAVPIAVINLKLQGDGSSLAEETEVKFQLSKDTLRTMVKSLYTMRDQLSTSATPMDDPLDKSEENK